MRTVICIVLVCVLCGCSTKKKISESIRKDSCRYEQSDVSVSAEKVGESTVSHKEVLAEGGESELEYETVTRTTEYDVSMPVSEKTGKHPIVRETETRTAAKKKDASKSIFGSENSEENVSRELCDVVDKSKGGMSVIEEEKTDRKVDRNFFDGLLLWVVVGCAVGVAVVYCVKKNINPVKTAIKWIKSNFLE